MIPTLHRYLRAVSTGQLDEAVSLVSPNALSALPPAGPHEETAPRRQAADRGQLKKILPGSFGEGTITVLTSATGGDGHWLLEGRIESDPAETLIASFTTNGELISRQLVFRCQLVEPPPHTKPDTDQDALTIVERYFGHLEAADMPAAVACFSDDTLYSHPPYKHAPEEGRAEFRGHAELLAGFKRRGYRTVRHELLAHAQSGPDLLVEGGTDDEPAGGSFISSVSVDGDGRIRRYVALFTQPRVPFTTGR
jgi:ketosteroid isomerase-like protein